MKLELKHLAPYLPYGVEYFNTHEDFIEQKGIINLHSCFDILRYEYIKPLLRPLSDLTKEIEETEECLLDYIVEKLGNHCVNYDDWVSSAIEDGIEIRILQAPYEVVEYCFENHYDVFGLIEQGLAVDINTLEK